MAGEYMNSFVSSFWCPTVHQICRRGWTQVETSRTKGCTRHETNLYCVQYTVSNPRVSLRYDTVWEGNKIMSRSNQVQHWDIPVHMKRRNPVRLQCCFDNLRRTRQVLGPRVFCFSSPLLAATEMHRGRGCEGTSARGTDRPSPRVWHCAETPISSITTYIAESLITCTSTLTGNRTQSDMYSYCMATQCTPYEARLRQLSYT